MGGALIMVQLSQVLDGITVTGSIAIDPAALQHVPEAAAALAPGGSTPGEARQAVNARLHSALLQWLAQGHEAAAQSLAGVASGLLADELRALQARPASIEPGAA